MQNWPTKENLYLELDIMRFKVKKKVLGKLTENVLASLLKLKSKTTTATNIILF